MTLIEKMKGCPPKLLASFVKLRGESEGWTFACMGYCREVGLRLRLAIASKVKRRLSEEVHLSEAKVNEDGPKIE